MKGKRTIVLLGLALVFGMIAASCDNGAYPTLDDKDPSTIWAYDGRGNAHGAPNSDPPTLLDAKTVSDALADYTDVSTGDQINRVKTYLLSKVATVNSGVDTEAEIKLKTTYAGMTLLIKNPILP